MARRLPSRHAAFLQSAAPRPTWRLQILCLPAMKVGQEILNGKPHQGMIIARRCWPDPRGECRFFACLP